MLGVYEHMDLKLLGREIIFEEFQHICTRYLIVTDRRTNRRLTVASPRSALASRGKNTATRNVEIPRFQPSRSGLATPLNRPLPTNKLYC